MSDQPLVTAVMLTADRQEMAERALRCFLRQSYENKRLLIYDTGDTPFTPSVRPLPNVAYMRGFKAPIGELRNVINDFACDSWGKGEKQAETGHTDIIAHWDDDDISNPGRLSEQVAALLELQAQKTAVRIIGSRDMWFWDEKGEAWYYKHHRDGYATCTSLMYWADVWKQHGFEPCQRAEDNDFLRYHGCSLGFLGRDWVIGTIHEGNRLHYDEYRKPGMNGFTRGTAADYERIRAIVEAA